MRKLLELILALILSSAVAGGVFYLSMNINNRKELSDINFVEYTGVGSGKNLTQNAFVLMYDPKCQFCAKVLETFDQLVVSVPEIGVYSIDCKENWKTCRKFKVKSYPTMMFFTTDGKQKSYQRNRSLESLIEFVRGGYKNNNLEDITFQPEKTEPIYNNIAYVRAALINAVIIVGGPIFASVYSFLFSFILLLSVIKVIKGCFSTKTTKNPYVSIEVEEKIK